MAIKRDFVVKNGLVVTEDIELGHATDTTIARASAGAITVEGVAVPTVSSTSTLTNKTLTAPVINIGSDAEGDIYYRTSGGAFTRLARGSDNQTLMMNGNVPNWETVSAGGGGIASLAADTTPQLGGDLDVDGNDIVSTSNGPIDINPHGTGKIRINTTSTDGVKLDVRGNNNETVANFRIQTSSTNAVQTAIQLIAGTTGTAAGGLGAKLQFRQADDGYGGYAAGSIYSSRVDNSNHHLYITPEGTGDLVLDGLKWPQADGTANYVLKTDGNAQLSWTEMSSGASDLDGLSDAKSGGTDFTDSLLIGHQTHGTLDNALYNTGVGVAALDALTSGDSNVAVGRRALSSLNTGVENTFVGRNSGFVITSGNRNIGIGHKAADAFDTESDNIAIGDDALGGSIAGGEKNVAIGNGVGASVTSGDENVLVGHMAGAQLSTGGYNVAVGAYALENSDVGAHNIAIGHEALECGASNSDVDDNVAIGTATLKAAIDGTSGNVAIGRNALTLATKDDNVAVGLNAANSITTGERNVFIGTEAGHALADDNNSVIIGYQAGDNLTAGNGNVVIGCYTDAPSATDDGQLVIGTSSAVNSPYYWILGDSTGAITFNHKADVVAVSGNTVLTLAQTGSYIYWTAGTLTLPASGTVGTQYTVINNTGGSATVAVNGSNCSMVAGFTGATNATTAIADHELASFVCVTANTWIQVG